MRALFDTYPDACVIWVHRDPIQVIASRIVLSGELAEMLTGAIDWKEHARIHREAATAEYLNTLQDPVVADSRIHHVRYTDFVADPVATLQTFYKKFDVPFTRETKAAMRGYLETNKADRYGKFRYSADVIDTDLGELSAKLAPYRERFGLETERKP